MSQYEGGYTDYQIEYERRHPAGSEAKERTDSGKTRSEKRGAKKSERKRRFTYQEQKDWEVIEDQIQALEEELALLDERIEDAARDFEKLKELMEEKEEKESVLESKMERWIYLNELAEEMASDGGKN